jgi:hypothetical protein
MSLYFQDVRGYSALRTGLALLPEAALLTIASAVSGRLMARTGPRIPMLTRRVRVPGGRGRGQPRPDGRVMPRVWIRWPGAVGWFTQPRQ